MLPFMSWLHACCQYGTLANTSLHVIHNANFKSKMTVHQHYIPLIGFTSSRLLAKILLNIAVIYTAIASGPMFRHAATMEGLHDVRRAHPSFPS